jgi:hypothetical protein
VTITPRKAGDKLSYDELRASIKKEGGKLKFSKTF